MSDQHEQRRPSLHEPEVDDHVGDDPMHPHPQDQGSSDVGKSDVGKKDDDSPVERYRDSPGLAVADESSDVAEPNEPG